MGRLTYLLMFITNIQDSIMEFKVNDRVKITAYERNGKVIQIESGFGKVVCVRKKFIFAVLNKNNYAIKFDKNGVGVNCMYKTMVKKC